MINGIIKTQLGAMTSTERSDFKDECDDNYLSSTPETATLLFSSGFDGITITRSPIADQKLSGTDTVTGDTWNSDLPGNNSKDNFNYVINDYNYWDTFVDTAIVTTTGYDSNPTEALYIEFIQDDPNQGSLSRVQYNIWGTASGNATQRLDSMYIKYRIKAHIDGTQDWWMPIEWKQEGEHYRFGLYAYGYTDPHWYIKGEVGTLGGSVDWDEHNYDIPVTQDEWFTLECFWVGSSDPAVGQIKIAIDGVILFDMHQRTKLYNEYMYYFSPFKVYGSKGHSWITDVEMWDAPPVGSVLA